MAPLADHVDVVLLSLLAAFLYALAWVLQHQAASRAPKEAAMRPALVLNLARNPLWLAANALDLVAYGLRFVALRRGSLLLVEPLLVTALLFALPLGAGVAGSSVRRQDWWAAGALVGGLALFLTLARPGEGQGDASGLAWLVVGALCAGTLGLLLWRGRPGGGRRRALHLGAASGVLFGLTAMLTKACAHRFDAGLVHVLSSWQPYALVAFAGAGLVISQTAFQAGPLTVSLPALTLGEPAVAALFGVVAFHERVASSGVGLGLEVVAALAMAMGVVMLARAPAIVETRELALVHDEVMAR